MISTKWETEIFDDFDGQGTNFTLDSIADIMTTEKLSNFYGGLDSAYQLVHDPALIAYRQEVDMLSHLSSDDPPIYIFSKSKAGHPSDDVLHHWYHSREVYNVAVQANVSEVKAEIIEYALDNTNGESGNDFLLRHLTSISSNPITPVLGIEPLNTVLVYPNPASTHFFVDLPHDTVEKVEVLSLYGAVVHRRLPWIRIPRFLSHHYKKESTSLRSSGLNHKL